MQYSRGFPFLYRMRLVVKRFKPNIQFPLLLLQLCYLLLEFSDFSIYLIQIALTSLLDFPLLVHWLFDSIIAARRSLIVNGPWGTGAAENLVLSCLQSTFVRGEELGKMIGSIASSQFSEWWHYGFIVKILINLEAPVVYSSALDNVSLL